MITDADAAFHTPTSDAPTWAETNYFGAYIPEVPINIGIWQLFRTNTGVAISTVAINSRFVDQPWQADFWDPQHNLAIPEGCDLRDYRLANGVAVKCLDPNRVWDVSYSNGRNVELSFRFTALGVPYDLSDPDQDPITRAKSADGSLAWGTAYKGHFDLTGHIEGELNLRGKTYAIDCVSTMDHSWGLRDEHQNEGMSWLHGHFSKDFAFHGIFDFGHEQGPDAVTEEAIRHGYILDHGEVHGIKAGTARAIRQGYYTRAQEIEVEDERGKTFRFTGFGRTSFPWQAGPGTIGYNTLAEWRHEGERGWGELQEFLGPQFLTDVYSAPRATGGW